MEDQTARAGLYLADALDSKVVHLVNFVTLVVLQLHLELDVPVVDLKEGALSSVVASDEWVHVIRFPNPVEYTVAVKFD